MSVTTMVLALALKLVHAPLVMVELIVPSLPATVHSKPTHLFVTLMVIVRLLILVPAQPVGVLPIVAFGSVMVYSLQVLLFVAATVLAQALKHASALLDMAILIVRMLNVTAHSPQTPMCALLMDLALA